MSTTLKRKLDLATIFDDDKSGIITLSLVDATLRILNGTDRRNLTGMIVYQPSNGYEPGDIGIHHACRDIEAWYNDPAWHLTWLPAALTHLRSRTPS